MGRITLWGFNNYDPTLFNDIRLPEACNKDVLIDTILSECGDLYPYYQQPTYLKRNINNWFFRMYGQFDRMFKALSAEYSPIENYDRYEEYLDNKTMDNNTEAHSNADSRGDREDRVSAYDSSTYQPDAKTDSTNHSENHQNTSGNASETLAHTAHLHGNIGTTKNTEMIQDELELRTYDVYLEIARLFERRFITQVY